MNELFLNIGCGYDIREGWINIDIVEREGVDVVLQPHSTSLPFDDNTVSHILMAYRYEFIQECKRVLKKHGTLHIKLPVHSYSLAHQSCHHSKDYFKCVHDDKRTGGFQKNKDFTLLYQRRNISRPIQLYYRFRNYFMNLFTSEWEYMLIKK